MESKRIVIKQYKTGPTRVFTNSNFREIMEKNKSLKLQESPLWIKNDLIKPETRKTMQIGDIVELNDNGKWHKAKIVKMIEPGVRVQIVGYYEGGNAKWDREIELTSPLVRYIKSRKATPKSKRKKCQQLMVTPTDGRNHWWAHDTRENRMVKSDLGSRFGNTKRSRENSVEKEALPTPKKPEPTKAPPSPENEGDWDIVDELVAAAILAFGLNEWFDSQTDEQLEEWFGPVSPVRNEEPIIID